MSGAKGERMLVESTALNFPSGVPGIDYNVFKSENFAFPILDYDWGPDYDHFNASGVPTNMPPPIGAVVKVMVPKVDADGNELGGVPTILRDAPLGTYLGWNITSSGFHAGQVCNYVGGMVPFAKTKAQRLATNDSRPSLEERYQNSHAGYVAAVKKAADNAACQGYLLAKGPAKDGSMPKCSIDVPAGFADDWAIEVNRAIDSNVCNQPGDGGKCNPLAP